MGRKSRIAAVALGAVLLAVGIAAQVMTARPDPGDRPPLGLFTSLPVYWGENADIGEALAGSAGARHWARAALEEEYRLVPLDTLEGDELKSLDRLIMAQPRALVPVENVALDDWVRAGGQLLLFADPMLTEHSRFALGDRRRPQDVVVLSPILRRWGLEMQFDENQPERRQVAFGEGLTVPVALAGTMTKVPPGAPAECELTAGGLVASCRIGQGAVMVIADAELLDHEGGQDDEPRLLAELVERAFP
jgi:hypothetical protein